MEEPSGKSDAGLSELKGLFLEAIVQVLQFNRMNISKRVPQKERPIYSHLGNYRIAQEAVFSIGSPTENKGQLGFPTIRTVLQFPTTTFPNK